jgi:opacity protein-like surface antigen
MTKFTLPTAAVLLAAMASTAFAGGYVAPVVEAPVYAPVVRAHDWSGAYAGFKAGQSSGAWDYDSGALTGDIDAGTALGLFAGYNLQSGNLVYGVEVGITKHDASLPIAPTATFDNFYEIKGRVGYAMDRFMVYGTLGYTSGGVSYSGTSYDLSGMTYGIGAEFMVTDRIFAGLEYQRANLVGTYLASDDVSANLDTVALRVGFQF